MKKFTAIILLAAVMLLALAGCLPVDGEPETGGAGMAGEVSRVVEQDVEPYVPETIEGWGDGLSSFPAYSWNGGLLEDIQRSRDFGDIWWINDGTVSALYGEEVFADAVCDDGVFRFNFSSGQDISALAAASGFTEEELTGGWTREWPWDSWEYAARGWELAATYKPLPEGQWVTPSWWLPPEGLTGRGEDMDRYWLEQLLGPFDEDGFPIPTPDTTPFPEDREAVEDFKFPGWRPVEEHEGYEISTVHATTDGRPLQVRLRWRNEEGFGFWAQLPAHALDSFWEHEREWFVKVTVPEDGEDSEPESSTSSTIFYHTEEGTFEIPAEVAWFPRWEDAEEPVSVEGVSMELVSIEDAHLDEEPEHEPYLDWKILTAKVTIDGELWDPEPVSLRVDFLYDETWHTVYRPWDSGERTAGAVCISGEAEQRFYVPADALRGAGQYRLCHKDFGTFEFTID